MPYVKEKCRAGQTIEYRYYYTYRYNDGGGRRRAKYQHTPEAQQEVNRRKAVRECTRLLNANFCPGDLYITYTYRKDARPHGEVAMRRQVKTLLDRLRRICRRNGSELKYIWTAEVGERGASHIHMVLSGTTSAREIQKAWSYGYIRVIPLDDTGQYRRLAEYLVKYAKKTEKAIGHPIGHRYNPSRNLRRPELERTAILGRRRIPEVIPVPKGWYLDKETEKRGINANGYEYLSYTLVKIDPEKPLDSLKDPPVSWIT